MKKVILLILFVPIYIYCQTSEKIEIGFVENGIAVITFEQNKLLRAFEIQYGDTLQASSLECISSSTNEFYLTAKLQNSNVNVTVAEQLVKEGQKLYVGAESKPSHACKGEPCSSCGIRVDNNGTVWCFCNHPKGVCNHIIYYPSPTFYDILSSL